MGNVRPKFIYAGSRLGAELLEGPFKRPGQANSMMTARTVRLSPGLAKTFFTTPSRSASGAVSRRYDRLFGGPRHTCRQILTIAGNELKSEHVGDAIFGVGIFRILDQVVSDFGAFQRAVAEGGAVSPALAIDP